ncbi:MAG: nuclear transport factor 2 family protein [Candidatus Kapaibacteriota bacterium]
MKLFLPLILITILFITSCQPEPKYLTADDIKKEENEIIKVVTAYNKASENKNFAELLKTLADSVVFFGSDQGEVIKTFADYKAAIQKQWDEYEFTKYGDITDVFITMDKNATLASIIYGVELDAKRGNLEEHIFLRASRTLRKQNDKWVIVSGITSIPRATPAQQVEAPDTTKQ